MTKTFSLEVKLHPSAREYRKDTNPSSTRTLGNLRLWRPKAVLEVQILSQQLTRVGPTRQPHRTNLPMLGANLPMLGKQGQKVGLHPGVRPLLPFLNLAFRLSPALPESASSSNSRFRLSRKSR